MKQIIRVIISLIIISIFFINCSNSDNTLSFKSNTTSVDSPRIDVSKYIDTNGFRLPDTLDFNMKEDLNELYIHVVNSINENTVSEILYNECLDIEHPSYCYQSSHKFISIRKDLIDTLKLNELKRVLEIGNLTRLKKTCIDSSFGIQKSNYELIIDRIKRSER